MRRYLISVASFLLLMAGPALAQASAATADKVKAAQERAAKDYIKHGLIQATENRHESAATSFRKAIELDPNNAEAYSLLGSTLAKLGKDADAEAALRKAVTLKPDYAEGWHYLGIFLEEKGRKAEAEEAFAKARRGRR
ncbi:MAG: tetratricopeptide repeat protein [Desulfobaccales bacterium]